MFGGKKVTSFRILPLTIFMGLMLLTIKLGSILQEASIVRLNHAHAKEDKTPVPPQTEAATPPDDAPKETAGPEEGVASESDEVVFKTLLNFNEEEASILKDLAKKKHDLEVAHKKLKVEERTLKALRNSLQQYSTQLAEKEKAVMASNKKDKKVTAKVKELAKIYQSMKAPEAARILATLDMDIVLKIFGSISAMKSAPILAAMPPEKAKEITEKMVSMV